MKKSVKQTVIPGYIVEMVKAILEADRKKQQLIIFQKRAMGKREAYRIARNVN